MAADRESLVGDQVLVRAIEADLGGLDNMVAVWSARRTLDAAAHAATARLSAAGVGAALADPAHQLRASLAALGATVITFFIVGAALWSQVAIGWRWERWRAWRRRRCWSSSPAPPAGCFPTNRQDRRASTRSAPSTPTASSPCSALGSSPNAPPSAPAMRPRS